MARTRTNLITEIERFYVRGDIADATWAIFLDLGLDTAVREHDWWDLFNEQTYATVANQEYVDLNANIRTLMWVRLNLTAPIRRPQLVYLPPEEFNRRFPSSTDSTGIPTHYTIQGPRRVLFGVIPDAIYTVRTHESRWPSTPFASGSGSTTSPIDHIDDYLIHFAAGWAFQTKGLDDFADRHLKLAGGFLRQAVSADSYRITELNSLGNGGYRFY